jgi:ribosome-associated heat shock protein Hsp15
MAPPSSKDLPEKVRLDKWLWAARFFKTRSLAARAVDGGKVHLNGERSKAGKMIRVGHQLNIRTGSLERTVIVRALSERRGPAREAAGLFEETPESIRAREALVERKRMDRMAQPRSEGRPDKRQRRRLREMTGKEW